ALQSLVWRETNIRRPWPQRLQRCFRPSPNTSSRNLRNSESCEKCRQTNSGILPRAVAGERSVASEDTRSNFTTTRACALSRSALIAVLSQPVTWPLDSLGLLAYESGEANKMGAAKIYFIVFGILTIAGGVVGYVKAGSVASIVAGGITGVLLLVAGLLLPEYRIVGLATACIVSLLLAA